MLWKINSRINPKCSLFSMGGAFVCCAVLQCTALGCAGFHKEAAVTPDQTYVSSMNYLVGASPQQAEELKSIWTARYRTEERLRSLYSSGEPLVGELEKLDKETLDKAHSILSTEQSAELASIFAKQRTFEQESVAQSKKIANKLAEEDRNRPPPRPKPPKEKGSHGGGPPQGGGGPM